MSILVIAAHPDDEVLGLGGTVARHAAAGDRIDVLIMAEGATSRGSRGGAVAALQRAARAAAKALGTRPPRFAGLPDNRMDRLELLDIVKRVEAVVAAVKPSIVYTHAAHDLNLDHRIVHQATVTACRPLAGTTVRAIYAFETPSSTEWAPPAAFPAFAPNRFVDIAATLDTKLAALRCYRGEMRAFPHPRSPEAIEALARWRGASSGFAAAEAFEIVRERVP
ncbi:MAG: PIG-L deacetylase family protein [Alphaproteobacteria bacterium]